MPKLKAVRDSLEGLDEALHGFYSQGEDERFYLELDGVDGHPTVLPALRKKDELLGEVKELKARAKLFEGIEDPEAARKALKRVPELEEALKGGGKDAERIRQIQAEYEQKLEQVQAATRREVEEATARADKADAASLDYFRRSEITKAITEAKGVPEFLEHIVAAKVKADRDENGGFKLQVLDAAGMPRVKDSKLTPMPLLEYVLELKQDPKYGRAFEPSQGGGSGATQGGSGGSGRPAASQTFDRNDPVAWGRNADKVLKGEASAA